MKGFGEKLTKSWDGNSTAAPSATAITDKEAAFKGFGSSMNALSFGFLATAILVSMFLIMAIFEHLLRSRAAHTSSQSGAQEPAMRIQREPAQMQPKKMKSSLNEATSTAADLSVLMPGQQYPTYIAQPAPLPCPREGVTCPYHPQHHHH